MTPGGAAICPGRVVHRRTRPEHHEFGYAVSYVWVDPDRPEELCAGHPLWSASRAAPARFRRRDYGVDPSGSLADAARSELAPAVGHRPTGPVRTLTQVRRWGWLFNPITVHVVWDAAAAPPVGAVLEVTNTPWKERIRYPIVWLGPDPDGWLTATVDKTLHVSPFLDEDHRYHVRLRGDDERIELGIDVVPRAGGGADDGDTEPVVLTWLAVDRRSPTRSELGRALVRPFAPTHRVSLAIHAQAARLWRKRVPFVPHPSKRVAA